MQIIVNWVHGYHADYRVLIHEYQEDYRELEHDISADYREPKIMHQNYVQDSRSRSTNNISTPLMDIWESVDWMVGHGGLN